MGAKTRRFADYLNDEVFSDPDDPRYMFYIATQSGTFLIIHTAHRLLSRKVDRRMHRFREFHLFHNSAGPPRNSHGSGTRPKSSYSAISQDRVLRSALLPIRAQVQYEGASIGCMIR